MNSDVIWLLWLFRIRSLYLSIIWFFICLSNTVFNHIKYILLFVQSFLFMLIDQLYNIRLFLYQTAWCITALKIISDEITKLCMQIIFITVTHSQLPDCVVFNLPAWSLFMIIFTVDITSVGGGSSSKQRLPC